MCCLLRLASCSGWHIPKKGYAKKRTTTPQYHKKKYVDEISKKYNVHLYNYNSIPSAPFLLKNRQF